MSLEGCTSFFTACELILLRDLLFWNEAPPYGISHGEENS